MPLRWIEALVAANEDIIASERRFHDHCALIVAKAASRQVTDRDEMLLASYGASLDLIRGYRNRLLAEVLLTHE